MKVIVLFSTMENERMSFPDEIERDFESTLDAASFLEVCISWYRKLKQFDPEYKNLIIDLYLWGETKLLEQIRIG